MLGNPDYLSLGEILVISVTGLAIVFLCLACLIVAIKVLGLVFAAAGKNQKPAAKAAPAPKAAPAAPAFDEETYAVLLAAVSDACGLPLDKFRVVSITEVA